MRLSLKAVNPKNLASPKPLLRKSSFFFFLFLGLFGSCGPRVNSLKHPESSAHTSSDENPTPEDGTGSYSGSSDINSAERTASNALVEEGRRLFETSHFDRAIDIFSQAIRVDPSNGIGYYFLAASKMRVGGLEDSGDVEGLIEKAESLLSQDQGWQTKIAQLRQDYQNKKH